MLLSRRLMSRQTYFAGIEGSPGCDASGTTLRFGQSVGIPSNFALGHSVGIGSNFQFGTCVGSGSNFAWNDLHNSRSSGQDCAVGLENAGRNALFESICAPFQCNACGSNRRSPCLAARFEREKSDADFLQSVRCWVPCRLASARGDVLGAGATDWHMPTTPAQRNKARIFKLIEITPVSKPPAASKVYVALRYFEENGLPGDHSVVSSYRLKLKWRKLPAPKIMLAMRSRRKACQYLIVLNPKISGTVMFQRN